MRRRIYYGWILVVVLGVTEAVSYGILSYAFPVFIAPMESELGWSRSAITGAFSVALLVSGLAALPAGRWVDRHGPRALMAGGSMLAAAMVFGWSRVSSLGAFYLLAVGWGMAMAAVLYEPAFTVVANWFYRYRGRALTILTFIAGFASVIFVPLAAVLVDEYGWRAALLLLAVMLAVLTVPPHGLLLRRRPEDLGLGPDGIPDGPAKASDQMRSSIPARAATRGRRFLWICSAFSLAAIVTTGVAVHLIPLLLERGYSPRFAGFALGTLGLMALPGRLVFTPLGDLIPRFRVTMGIFAVSGMGLAMLLISEAAWAVWIFVVLFGAGFGAITPARAALLADAYGRAEYGAIGGTLALWIALARAAAPVGLSGTHALVGGYEGVLMLLLALTLASTAAIGAAAGTASRRPTDPPLDL